MVSAVAVFMVWVILFTPEEATFWYLCQGLLAVWLILWMSWLVGANPKLVVTTSGLEVTNWFVQYWIPWRTIHWIQQSDEVVIHLRNGKKIKLVVGAWSLAGRFRANPQQLKIHELIDKARSSADDDPAADTEVLRKPGVHLIPAVAIFAAFVLFAYLVRG